MRFDRDKFFAGMRAWGTLTQAQVDGLNSLLDGFEADAKMNDVRWIAYALATVKHETADTYKPIAEYGKGKGKPYGVKDPETGAAYYGRGFVQLTWRRNYEKMGELVGEDLVNSPHLAMEPDIAYQIMSVGMRNGIFTGKKLADYIHGDTRDYLHARKIINAMDRAQLIADYAERFQKILEDATEPAPVAVSTETVTTTKTETASGVVEQLSSTVSSISSNAAVKEVASAGVTKLATRITTALTTTSTATATGGAATGKTWLIVLSIVLAVGAIAVVLFLLWHKSSKEKEAARINSDPTRHDIVFEKS